MTAREKVSDERLRELRDRQFSRVLNTPRPTIEELEKILQRDDLSVEILPNGEVRAVADTDKEMIVAAIDELLRLRTSQEWQPIESAPKEWGIYWCWVLSDKLGGTGAAEKSYTRLGWHCRSWSESPTGVIYPHHPKVKRHERNQTRN